MENLPEELLEFSRRLEARICELEERRTRLSGLVAYARVSGRGRRPDAVCNPFVGLRALLREDEEAVRAYGYPAWLDDVLRGVASLDWYRPNARSIPLSVRHMLAILDQLSVITAAGVSALLLVEVRQAQRYVQALRMAMPYLLAGMPVGTFERIAELQSGAEYFDDEEQEGIAA